MRIIGGMYGGRRFNPPTFFKARPTTDFAKESLFNLINNRIDLEGTRVLDLFAGTGSISYEFMSRGCISITSVDINPKYLSYIKKISEELNKEVKIVQTLKADVLSFLKKAELNYDLIFADPPYDLPELEQIPDLIYRNQSLKESSIVILEHSSKNNFAKHPHFEELRKYGSVNFSFFR
jgi:16S rRNA (guanine(966)-N(2))-methyltransferase RsmD